MEGKLLEILIVLFVIGLIVPIIRSKLKGYLGEKEVARNLVWLPEQHYRVLNDVMLQTSYGTTQIDHIVVSVYGIFVIETKNYKGLITGTEYADQWTKNMYGKKYSFYNPLKQNYGHVKALMGVLGMSENRFIPIVAFSSNCTMHVQTTKPIVYIKQIRSVIQSYQYPMFREDELEQIIFRIADFCNTSREARKQHIEQIHTKVYNQKSDIAKGICPKCGGLLVQRKGRYGYFIGCSNYPNCRYTKN